MTRTSEIHVNISLVHLNHLKSNTNVAIRNTDTQMFGLLQGFTTGWFSVTELINITLSHLFDATDGSGGLVTIHDRQGGRKQDGPFFSFWF